MKTASELCLDCMECCKSIGWYINSKDLHAIAFYVARGCKLHVYDQNSILVSVPHVCQHLGDQGCKIYDKRPLICKAYDGRMDPSLKGVCLWNLLG